jgi:hypothetical protein
MSLCVLVDTDHVTLFQRAHPVVVQRVAVVEPEALVVTVVTACGCCAFGGRHPRYT